MTITDEFRELARRAELKAKLERFERAKPMAEVLAALALETDEPFEDHEPLPLRACGGCERL